MAEGAKQLDSRGATRRDAAVGPDEVPGSAPVALRERSQQRPRRGIFERQQCEPPTLVEPGDGTRREAAEASAPVVEEHGPVCFHASILPQPRP